MSTHLMTHLLPQIHFNKNFLLATKAIWEREREKRKEGIRKLLISLNCLKIICLKILPRHQNKIYLWKWQQSMLSATHERVTVPVGRVKKIWTALRANQIVGFVTVPSEKKINFDISDYSSAITIASFPV